MADLRLYRRPWPADSYQEALDYQVPPSLSYADLPRVDIGDEEPIAEALARAYPGDSQANSVLLFLMPNDSSAGVPHYLDVVVLPDGRVASMPRVQRLREIRPSWIRRTVERGFACGDPNRLLLATTPPRGDGGHPPYDWVGFFYETGAEVLALYVLDKFRGDAMKSVNNLRNRKVRRIAQMWAQDLGLRSPRELRVFVDRKESWKASQLAEALGLAEAGAEDLLQQLGYEHNPRLGAWAMGRSAETAASRQVWIAAEAREPGYAEYDGPLW